MAKGYNQKLKILYLMELLQTKTDENHVLSMGEILESMKKEGISAARKSVYDDIQTLIDFGMDIEYRNTKPAGYYLASRTFELAELKLLVDAVQSSKFITEKKSRQLIKKLEESISQYEALALHRQIYVADRVKTMNESIYYNIDEVQMAILQNKKISFQYANWNIEKKLQLKNDGKSYRISPWALSWTDENYYLIGYDDEKEMLKHFRVDKMMKVNVLDSSREGKEIFRDFDLAGYCKKTFGMFAGTDEVLSIKFPHHLIGAIIDRFGRDVSVRALDEEFFIARVQVSVSEPFFGWLTGLGKNVIIIEPKYVADTYKQYLENLLKAYT